MSPVSSQQRTQSTTTALVCSIVNVIYEPELRYGHCVALMQAQNLGTLVITSCVTQRHTLQQRNDPHCSDDSASALLVLVGRVHACQASERSCLW